MREHAGSLNIQSARLSIDPEADPIADSTQTTSVSILKVGGSVLTLPDLVDRLQHVIQKFGIAGPVLVTGGGSAADTIRRLQPICGLSSEVAHWLAIDSMTQNAQWLARLHRQIVCVPDRDSAQAAIVSGLPSGPITYLTRARLSSCIGLLAPCTRTRHLHDHRGRTLKFT